MKTSDQLAEQIKIIILKSCELSLSSIELSVNEPLIGGRFNISSMIAIDILTAIEQLYGIEIPDEAISPDLFYSIESLSCCVESILTDTKSSK